VRINMEGVLFKNIVFIVLINCLLVGSDVMAQERVRGEVWRRPWVCGGAGIGRQYTHVRVESGGKVGLVSKNRQREIVPCVYNEIELFNYNRAIVDSLGKKGLIDYKGNVVLRSEYDSIVAPSEWVYTGYHDAYLLMKNGKWGMSDSNGRHLTPCEFDEVGSLNYSGRCRFLGIRKGGAWGVTSFSGRIIVPPQFKAVKWIQMNGQVGFSVLDFKGKWGIVDTNGVMTVPCVYKYLKVDDVDFAFFRSDSIWYCTDLSGIETSIGVFDRVESFQRKLIRVEKAKHYGIANRNGRILIPVCYDNITSFYLKGFENLFIFSNDGQKGVVKVDNKIIVPANYREIEILDDELIAAHDSVSTTLFDTSGRILKILASPILTKLAPNLYKAKVGGKYGVVKTDGKIVVPFFYDDVEDGDGVLFVVKGSNEKWGVVDTAGNSILPETVGHRLSIHNGRVALGTIAKSFVDARGRIQRPWPVNRRYASAGEFHEGRAMVEDSAGYRGYINIAGKEVIPCMFELAHEFHNGVAAVRLNQSIENVRHDTYEIDKPRADSCKCFGEMEDFGFARWGYIDSNGKQVIPFAYCWAGEHDARGFSVDCGGKWGYLKPGSVLKFGFEYDEPIYYDKGRAVVNKGDRWFVIDASGKERQRLCENGQSEWLDSKGMARVMENDSLYIVDARCRKNTYPFESLSIFNSAGVAAFTRVDSADNDNIGFVNRNLKVVKEPCFATMEISSASPYTVVSNDTGYGVIDANMQLTVPCRYDKIDADLYNQGLFATKKDDKWGYIDTKGLWVVMPKYDEARPFSEGLAAVKKDDVWMYIDKQGKEVLRFE
jgi:hypothetical protein